MREFVAIDFETANAERTSICSVGAVLVRDGEVIETLYRLVHPEPDYYSYFCTRVHGITHADTISAPTFDRVWHDELAPFIGDAPLIAHNKAFDEGCLRATLALYGIAPSEQMQFYCTLQQARRTFGKLLPNHRLNTVSRYLGYELDNHHHALADALACAHIATRLFADID